jgi:pimeloyl-ACP methyl ester carboxylesterase
VTSPPPRQHDNATAAEDIGDLIAVHIDGIGHHVAMEAPGQLATALRSSFADVDRRWRPAATPRSAWCCRWCR